MIVEISVRISFAIPIYERHTMSYVNMDNAMGNERYRAELGLFFQKLITDITDASAGRMLKQLFHVKTADNMLQSRKSTSHNLLFAHFLSWL